MVEQNNMTRIPVASGSYVISKGGKKLLDAHLGTCVGVTLSSRNSNIGGLIHILLPEPYSGDPFGNPENYASTGLPLFINEMRTKKGNNGDELVATVAGGALVGPISDLDLNLDIGGRTVEIVERILGEEKIPIQKSETGGYFSCQISLDLSSWESRIEPLNSELEESSEENFIQPTDEQLEVAIANVTPIPQIVLKVLRMLQSDVYNMVHLAKEIKQDQIISAKILRLCNSAFFSQNMEVDSIDRALVVLGEKRLLQLVVSASMENFFSNKMGGYSLCKGGLFKHSVGTAMICEKLAGFSKILPKDLAYTAGLLHDIGKVALDQYMNLAYPMFYRRVQENTENLINVEKELFGLNHTEVGGRLAEKWDLPERLKEVIEYHHNPEKARVDPELTHLVYVADLIMSRFVVGQELERLNTNSLGARLEKIGVKSEQFQVLIENIAEIIHNLSS
jgi:putative nucleotidyltransferase with HDIG domain